MKKLAIVLAVILCFSISSVSYAKMTVGQVSAPSTDVGSRYIKIMKADKIYKHGKVKYHVKKGDTLRLLGLKNCRDGEGICYEVKKFLSPGEEGYMRAEQVTLFHRIYTESPEATETFASLEKSIVDLKVKLKKERKWGRQLKASVTNLKAALEINLNTLGDTRKELDYVENSLRVAEGVYKKELNTLKKQNTTLEKIVKDGMWNSSHVVDVLTEVVEEKVQTAKKVDLLIFVVVTLLVVITVVSFVVNQLRLSKLNKVMIEGLKARDRRWVQKGRRPIVETEEQ